MKAYQFVLTLTVEASSEADAKQRAQNTMSNLGEMTGHAPYSVSLDLDEESCEEVELEDEDYE